MTLRDVKAEKLKTEKLKSELVSDDRPAYAAQLFQHFSISAFDFAVASCNSALQYEELHYEWKCMAGLAGRAQCRPVNCVRTRND
jgi:hypothetical protein